MDEIKFIKNKKAHAQWAKFCVYKGMEAKGHLITQIAEQEGVPGYLSITKFYF